MSEKLEKEVSFSAIGYGLTGFDSFLKGDAKGPFWTGQNNLYADHTKEVFHTALNGPRQGSAWGLLYPSVVSAVAGATSSSDVSKAGGDQFNLGGTFVVKDDEVLFLHLQETFADHPDLDALVAAANGSCST